MKTVYRVEHAEGGYGPYLKQEADEDLSLYTETHYEVAGLHDAHRASVEHPPPGMDGLMWDITDEHVHGVDSLELLDTWFEGFHKELDKAGFVIRVYKAPKATTFTGESGKQTIFIKADSKVVDTLPILR